MNNPQKEGKLRTFQIICTVVWMMGTMGICIAAPKSFEQCLADLPADTEYPNLVAHKCVIDSLADPPYDAQKDQRFAPERAPSSGKSADDCESELAAKGKVFTRGDVARCILEATGSDRAEPKRDPNIYITDYGIDRVDSAGGVEPFVVLINPQPSSHIKYLRLTMQLYNAVGDIVASDITRTETGRLLYTGPLSYNDGQHRAEWGPVWYNYAGHCVVISQLSIEHMNGKKLSLSGPSLRKAIAPAAFKNCRVR